MFTLAKKNIEAKKYGFNFLCYLDEHGIEAPQGLTLIRAYVAYCADLTLEEAGDLIEEHLIGGGTLDEITNIVTEAIEKSNFMKVAAVGTNEENA